MCKDSKIRLEIKLSEKLIKRLKKDHSNISKYIEELIKKDYESPASVKDDSENTLEKIDTLELEDLKEFLKNHRKSEWIEYILETRGEQAIRKEAKRIAGIKPNEWSEFLKMRQNNL